MRRRITFVEPHITTGLKQLDVHNNSLHIKSLEAAREERWTVGLYELPQQIWRALKQCHELHIRWSSETLYTSSIAPFVSTVAPGLHISFTPQKERSADLLCPTIRKIFGGRLNCTLPEDSFSRVPVNSERFASSAAQQYYESLPLLDGLVVYIQQKICPQSDVFCKTQAAYLSSASYVDIDFDTISQSLNLIAFWDFPPESAFWDEQVDTKGGSVKVEVGVLTNEKATQPEDLSLGGALITLGEDTKPNPTLFSFPSRHHVAPSQSDTNFTAAFIQPTGLHPTLRVSFPALILPPSPSCALHIYLTLPSHLFPDKYQLSTPNLLASKNLHSIRSLAGETDLEAPNWSLRKWGSAMLLELAPPHSESQSTRSGIDPEILWHADIPLHLRYLPPTATGQHTLPVPLPPLFWACPSDEGTKMNTNPFDRVNLGYDTLFGPRTMFYHLQPADLQPRVEYFDIPALDLEKVEWVERGTMGVVIVGFLWVVWTLFGVAKGDWSGGRVTKAEKDV